MIRLFSVILVLCLLVSTGHSIDSADDAYDCDVPPPLNVDPFTCCRVSKPFERQNFPECFALPPPPAHPSSKIFLSSSTLSSVSEDFHEDYTLTPTRSSIFKKKFKLSPYRTSTNRPTWPAWDHHRDGSDSDGSDADYDKDKYHYYHHHDGSGHSGSENNGGRSSGYGFWPGKHQHYGNDNNQRSQYFGGYHHQFGRHRRYAPIYRNNAQTSNLCAIECIFNQTNIITNGRFIRDNALDVYADYYPEIPIDLLTRTVDVCTRQLRNYQIARRRRSRNQIQQRNAPIPLNKRCRNGAGFFAACFNREVYRNCPSEIDTISDDCTAFRSFIDTCSPLRGARLNFSYDNVDVDENGNFFPQDY